MTLGTARGQTLLAISRTEDRLPRAGAAHAEDRDAVREGGMKALALVEAPDHVCARYRVRAFGPALAEAGIALTVEGLAAGPFPRLAQFRRASAFVVVLLQRKLLSA